MKKLAFLLVLVFSVSTIGTYAQTEKGKLFLHGSSNLGLDFGKSKTKYDGTTDDNYKYADFNFRPMVGYTVIDNMPIGLFFNLDTYRTKWIDSDSKYSGNSLLIGPFIRFYPFELECFRPVAELGSGIGFGRNKSTYGDTENINKSFDFYFWTGIGGTFFPTEYLGIDAIIGFERESYKYKESTYPDSRQEGEGHTYIYAGMYFRVGLVIMLSLKSTK